MQDRYTVISTWEVQSAKGIVICRRLRDWSEHIKARQDKYWKRPAGRK